MQISNNNQAEQLRGTLNNLMTSQIFIMRSIKSNELSLVNYYIIVMVAAIGFFSYSHSFFKDIQIFQAIQSLMLVFTLWFINMLFLERESYYTVARSLGRIQNYLGLFGRINSSSEREGQILSLSVLDSGFPKGLGVNKANNGTKPDSFLWRVVVITAIYGAFLIISYNKKSLVYSWRLLLFMTVLIFVADIFFRRDPRTHKKNVLKEKGLLGFEDGWI